MRGLNRAEGAALREIARRHGYLVTSGPTAKDGAEAGNPIALLLAIISGEVATVLLGDDEMRYAAAKLLASDDEILQEVGQNLQAAVRRQALND